MMLPNPQASNEALNLTLRPCNPKTSNPKTLNRGTHWPVDTPNPISQKKTQTENAKP